MVRIRGTIRIEGVRSIEYFARIERVRRLGIIWNGAGKRIVGIQRIRITGIRKFRGYLNIEITITEIRIT